MLRLKDLTISELKQQIEALLSTRDRLITQHPNDQIKTAVAFGPGVVDNSALKHQKVLNNSTPQSGAF